MWILKTLDHNIIWLLDGNNTVQYSWRQLNKCNNPFENNFTATEIVKTCKPALLQSPKGWSYTQIVLAMFVLT